MVKSVKKNSGKKGKKSGTKKNNKGGDDSQFKIRRFFSDLTGRKSNGGKVKDILKKFLKTIDLDKLDKDPHYGNSIELKEAKVQLAKDWHESGLGKNGRIKISADTNEYLEILKESIDDETLQEIRKSTYIDTNPRHDLYPMPIVQPHEHQQEQKQENQTSRTREQILDDIIKNLNTNKLNIIKSTEQTNLYIAFNNATGSIRPDQSASIAGYINKKNIDNYGHTYIKDIDVDVFKQFKQNIERYQPAGGKRRTRRRKGKKSRKTNKKSRKTRKR